MINAMLEGEVERLFCQGNNTITKALLAFCCYSVNVELFMLLLKASFTNKH